MIQMGRDGRAGFNFGGLLYQRGQIGVVGGVLTGAGGRHPEEEMQERSAPCELQ